MLQPRSIQSSMGIKDKILSLDYVLVISILIYYSSLFAIDAYVIGDSTMDYLFPTWPAKFLVPIGFSVWLIRLFLELVGYFRMLFFVNSNPLYIPIIKSAEELANEEIKSIRD